VVLLEIFFRGSFRQNHEVDSASENDYQAACAYGFLLVPNVEMIRGLNLPGTPRTT